MASAITFIGLFASDAQAATVASLSVDGTLSIFDTADGHDATNTLGTPVVFFDEDLWDSLGGSSKLLFSANLSAAGNSWSEALTATKADISDFLEAVVSVDPATEIMAVIDYIIGEVDLDAVEVGDYEYGLDFSISAVPLPATAPLLLAGLGGLWLRRRIST